MKPVQTALAIAAMILSIVPATSAGEVPHHDPKIGRTRPVITVVGLTRGSETTDYVIPWAVLTQSGAAEVFALGTEAGPIQMMPALKIDPQMTIEQFDARVPDGADYVIVPAVHDPKDG